MMGELYPLGAAAAGIGGAGAGLAVIRCARRCFGVRLHRGLAVAACVVVGAALGLRAGPSAWLAPLAALGWAGVAISCIDLRTHLIPTRLLQACALAAVGLLCSAAAVEGGLATLGRTLGAAALGGLLGWAAMHMTWKLARGGMGYGDVRLGGYLGMHLGLGGVEAVLWGLLAGFAVASAVGLVAVTALRRGAGHKFAMGPSLVAGALAVIWWSAPGGLAI